MAREDWTPDQTRILRMVGEVIRANAADLESFETYHFANDPFRGIGGRRMAEALFGGTGGLATVLAGMNAAVFPPVPPTAAEPGQPSPSP